MPETPRSLVKPMARYSRSVCSPTGLSLRRLRRRMRRMAGVHSTVRILANARWLQAYEPAGKVNRDCGESSSQSNYLMGDRVYG